MKYTGFTLVEALVAIAVLTVGLIPAFKQATNALTLAATIQDSLIATNLAQEGVEVVRAMRDSNWFTSSAFTQGLTGCPAPASCRVQWDSTSVLGPAANPPLKVDPATGLYQYTTGTDTAFTRNITLDQLKSGPTTYAVKVTSTVSWNERGTAKSYTVEEYLFDWR